MVVVTSKMTDSEYFPVTKISFHLVQFYLVSDIKYFIFRGKLENICDMFTEPLLLWSFFKKVDFHLKYVAKSKDA